ncbi:glycosyltransferase family A protein [Ichthyenterobacterium sp. W332]|uniref:Glycosyltransferase family A protein n=1 Tax=Microcosmobacter mediterraneus TaxID=3075607 RepID=A0ABU2YMX7_9FLAO|nr:glycosyltransferase family A protein [Ichthyenterobacterium sp. W332]MDT0559241.1 glycosyltransferase family A protein [Ichthyenterobacterium sp. W332]
MDRLFVHNSLEDFNIIIINQTSSNALLESSNPNIKVINSFAKGSPASRNLAIKNSTADICLMADDDIVYEPNLKATILSAYQEHPEADFISFEAKNEFNKSQAPYPQEGWHSKSSLTTIFTWVITFKRDIFSKKSIYFNHHFGVGSTFKGSTEYVFLRNAFDKGLRMYHVPKTIVMHPEESSGRKMGSDNAFYASSARTYRFHGNLSYFWLVKYIFNVLRNKHISLTEIPHKFRVGCRGISKYKALEKSRDIDNVYFD